MKKLKERKTLYYQNCNLMSYDNYYKFRISIGARGIGKTYNTWRYVIKKWINEKALFIWLRGNESATKKMLATKGMKLMPKELLIQYKIDMTIDGSKIYFNGEFAGEILALSTFASGKGSTYDKRIKTIVLDEFNKEKTEKNDLDMSYSFVNQLETIVRLRRDVRVVLLGNTIEESSEILSTLFKFVPRQYGIYKLHKKRAIIEYVPDSDLYNKEREESLAGILLKDSTVDGSSIKNKTVSLGALLVVERGRIKTPIFLYRIWFSNSVSYDVYSGKWGDKSVTYVCESDSNVGKSKQIVAMRELVTSDAPYYEEIVKGLFNVFDMGKLVFENQSISILFKKHLLSVKR